MDNEKETFGQKMLNLWYNFLAIFGLSTTHQLKVTVAKEKELADKRCDEIRDGYAKIIKENTEKFDEYEQRISDIKKILQLTQEKYEAAAAQALRYRDEVSMENLGTIKELQKQIGKIYGNSPNFGFPHSLALPGSATITDSSVKTAMGEFANIRVRMIATDDETTQINQEPDMRKRYAMMIDYLKRRGLLEKIGERMISDGAATLAIAYNGDCTNFEIFAELTAMVLPDAGTIRAVSEKEEPDNG